MGAAAAVGRAEIPLGAGDARAGAKWCERPPEGEIVRCSPAAGAVGGQVLRSVGRRVVDEDRTTGARGIASRVDGNELERVCTVGAERSSREDGVHLGWRAWRPLCV